MERKIQMIERVLSVMPIVSMVLWFIVTRGIFSWATAIAAVLLIVFFLLNRKHGVMDERERYLHLMASYGAFSVTVCYFFIVPVIQYLRPDSHQNAFGPLFVLLVSQEIFKFIFRKSRNA